MLSRQVGSLAVALAFALFAVFLYCARDDNGAWRDNYFCLRTSGECVSKAPVADAETAAETAAPPKSVSTPISKEVKDEATGLVLPRTKRFSTSALTCLGVGVRAKTFAIAKVKVYTVGLYVEPKGARRALKKYAGADPAKLSNDASLFKSLGQAGGFNKYLHLVFARVVGAQKVVDALTAVTGVREDVLSKWVCGREWAGVVTL